MCVLLVFIFHFSCSNLDISIGCCAIFLAWIDLLLFLQKFPSLGIYVVMFTDVLKTFLRFSITFILFLVAFGLGFYTLLYDGNTVSSVLICVRQMFASRKLEKEVYKREPTQIDVDLIHLS